jgi:hypothetical protein
MQTSRRVFLKNGALTVAGATMFSNFLMAAANAGTELVGVQLYSVRDDMKADALGTLKKIAAIGYKNVEHAGYSNRKFYGYSATEFKKILDDLGMKMPSGHTVMRGEHWKAEGRRIDHVLALAVGAVRPLSVDIEAKLRVHAVPAFPRSKLKRALSTSGSQLVARPKGGI